LTPTAQPRRRWGGARTGNARASHDLRTDLAEPGAPDESRSGRRRPRLRVRPGLRRTWRPSRPAVARFGPRPGSTRASALEQPLGRSWKLGLSLCPLEPGAWFRSGVSRLASRSPSAGERENASRGGLRASARGILGRCRGRTRSVDSMAPNFPWSCAAGTRAAMDAARCPRSPGSPSALDPSARLLERRFKTRGARPAGKRPVSVWLCKRLVMVRCRDSR
jgi:hypothetical protein